MTNWAIQRVVADLLAWVLAITCLVFLIMNLMAIKNYPKSPSRFFWIVQCFPLSYGIFEFSKAAITHNSIGRLNGRAAVLMIVGIALAERIALVRSRNNCD